MPPSFFIWRPARESGKTPSLLLCHEGRDQMSDLQIIEELCGVCADMVRIISAQAIALEQLGAVCMEEERTAITQRLAPFVGNGEIQIR